MGLVKVAAKPIIVGIAAITLLIANREAEADHHFLRFPWWYGHSGVHYPGIGPKETDRQLGCLQRLWVRLG